MDSEECCNESHSGAKMESQHCGLFMFPSNPPPQSILPFIIITHANTRIHTHNLPSCWSGTHTGLYHQLEPNNHQNPVSVILHSPTMFGLTVVSVADEDVIHCSNK